MGQNQSNNLYVTTNVGENQPFKIANGRYIWIVENFKNLKLANGSFITSQRIKVDVNGQIDEWEMVCYPNGFNERTAAHVSVWLKRISNIERLVQFTCEIPKASSKGEELVKKTAKKKLTLETFLGWPAFCRRSDILENEKKVLNNGNLVLICNLDIYDDTCISPVMEDEDPDMDARLPKLSKDIHKLLLNQKHYDVAFKIEKKKFLAHKAILAARSPVFREMFDSQLEDEYSEVEVTDISRETFAATLLFMYSGQCVEKEFDSIFKLYHASYKYELLSLTRICSMILIESLSLENVIKVSISANKPSDRILQYAAVNFVAKNFKEIQKKEEWISLVKDFPHIANKIFECLSAVQRG